MLLAFIATNTVVLDSVLTVFVRANRSSYRLQSCEAIIVATVSFCCSSILLYSVSCTQRCGKGEELSEDIFLLLGKTLKINSLITDVPRWTWTVRLKMF